MYHLLSGAWHLHHSTFPMWHKPGTSGITFNYTPIIERGKQVLKDEVKYYKKGTPKCLKGYDISDAGDDRVYTWRGYGLLMLFSSRWRLEWMSGSQDCIIVSFARTFITPAGIDILSRTVLPDPTSLAQALEVIAAQNLLANVKEPLLPVL